MATDIKALSAAVKLLADAASDSVKMESDTGVPAKLAEYKNLIQDVIALVPLIGEIPAEAKALQPEDYAALLAELGTDFVAGDASTENKVWASVDLLKYLVGGAPKVEALIAAFKAPAPAPAPAA